jgi:nitrogen fixation protein FixH
MTRVRNFLRIDEDHPFTGWHMLVVVLLFFGTIIAVNIVMVVSATGTFPGLVVHNSYVASQNFNRTLAEARAQDQTGWRMELDARDGILGLRLTDRDGVLLRRLEVTAEAGRPSTTDEDRTILLVEDETGYRATAALPPGQWDLAVEARKDGERVFGARQRLHVSPKEAD